MKLEVNLDDRNEIAKAFQLLGSLLGVKFATKQPTAQQTTGEPAASEPAAGSGDSAPAPTAAAPTTPTTPEPTAQPPQTAQGAEGVPPAGSGPVEKRQRKPRSDAGKPRGASKTDGAAQEPASGETTAPAGATSSAGGVASQPAPAAQPAGSSPAASTLQAEIEARNAAARASVSTPPQPNAAPPSAPAAAGGGKPTHDDFRNQLARLNKVQGLGMAACQQFIAAYRTNEGKPITRISDVPVEEYGRWTAAVDARIAAFEKDGK